MLSALTLRTARSLLRAPNLALAPVVMSVFFLAVYAGQWGNTGETMLEGREYLGFLLPVVLVTTAFNGGALAGLLIARDVSTGYHRRLLLTQAGPTRLTIAPLIVGASILVLQSTLMVSFAWILGMRDTTIGGAVAMTLGVVLAGIGFALLGAAAAVRTGTEAAVNTTVFVFFPLAFLTSAFAPRDEMVGWMAGIAQFNPLTYLVEGLRSVGGGPAPSNAISMGLVVLLALIVAGSLACAFAFRSARTAR